MNERDIFIGAVQRPAPADRRAYLELACGNDDRLRRRVEDLLAAFDQAGSFLREPTVAPVATAEYPSGPGSNPAAFELPGTVIGPYKLMEQIGEGGMGVVYVAAQHQPVRRKVALKIIKPGMDTKQVIARFEAERQALAMMDHPNIARVIDGGVSPHYEGGRGGDQGGGRPYFVMELVRGIPITDYCDRERLSIPERLELFVQVCRAVQHAHQKGIIHRDLKPSNILVTVIDGAAVPKVIDFGVAKAIGASLTDRTVYTAFHQFVGTPLYMSPEQADLAGADVDTRSDIYSLGVLLYELLTSTTPFASETFRHAAFDEVRRIIREQEPPRPSTRLSSLGATRAAVSAHRKADARQLDRAVRGELDWIVMKALDKDRRRRYETANDFAADVMRYLVDEPVAACPPSAWYRSTKYVRRNKVVLVTAGLVLAALLIGTAISVWQALEAQHARRLADRLLENEKQARSHAEFQRGRAQQNFDRAINWMSDVHRKFYSNASRDLPQQTRRNLSDYIAQFFQEIVTRRGEDKLIRLERAQAYLHLGLIYGRDGKYDQLIRAYDRAIVILKALTAEYPLEPVHWEELGQAHSLLGSHLLNVGHTLEAEREYQEAGNAYRQAVKVDPSAARGLTFLVGFLSNCRIERLRAPDEAVSLARRFVELAPESHRAWQALGFAEYRAGNWRASKAALQQSLDRGPAIFESPSLYILAMSHWKLGEQKQALRWLQRVNELLNENGFPEDVQQVFAPEAAQLLGLRTGPGKEPGVSPKCKSATYGRADQPADVFARP
jgi:serine/threonine protein kinase